MSKHKSRGPKTDKPTTHGGNPADKETTKRHVYVEPGVQIDVVQDLKHQHETERAEDAAAHKKQLFWTRVAAVLVLIYTVVSGWQGFLTRNIASTAQDQAAAAQKQFISSQRA